MNKEEREISLNSINYFMKEYMFDSAIGEMVKCINNFSPNELALYNFLCTAIVDANTDLVRGIKKKTIQDEYEKLFIFFDEAFKKFSYVSVEYADDIDREICNRIVGTIITKFSNIVSTFFNWANAGIAGWAIVLIRINEIKKRFCGHIANISQNCLLVLNRFTNKDEDTLHNIEVLNDLVEEYIKYGN